MNKFVITFQKETKFGKPNAVVKKQLNFDVLLWEVISRLACIETRWSFVAEA